MNVSCKDRERIFADGSPAEWAALQAHAAACPACAEELRAWKSLSSAAAELRDYSESPTLWPRIHEALVQQADRRTKRAERWNWRWLLAGVPLWQAAAIAAVLLLLIAPAIVRYVQQRRAPQAQSADLLRQKALTEVERAEAAYVQAIDKLALQAKPQLETPDTPLMASYREKLQVLDSAISDLQAQAGQNPSNAHLRHQLLAMYQEKERTLEQVLEEKR
jgi:Tfp pilus assembly protein PilE